MSKNIHIKKITAAAYAAAVVALASACGAEDLLGSAESEPEGPIVALITDASGSTKRFRRPGGAYEQDALETMAETAGADGTLWAMAADGNAVGRGTWQITDESVTTIGTGGNAELAVAQRKRRGERKLTDPVRRLVRTTGRGGSDLLGGLSRAASLLRDHPERERVIVLLSDGALNVPGRDGYSVYQNPPITAEQRRFLIRRLRAAGELPDLTGSAETPTKVYLGGIGAIADRRTAKAVVALWEDLVKAMHGELLSIDSRLRLEAFPAPE